MTECHIATQRFTLPHSASLDQHNASQWAEVARAFKATMTVKCGDKTANGKQERALAALGAQSGTMISVMAQGDDAFTALEAIESLLHSAFRTVEGDGRRSGCCVA